MYPNYLLLKESTLRLLLWYWRRLNFEAPQLADEVAICYKWSRHLFSVASQTGFRENCCSDRIFADSHLLFTRALAIIICCFIMKLHCRTNDSSTYIKLPVYLSSCAKQVLTLQVWPRNIACKHMSTPNAIWAKWLSQTRVRGPLGALVVWKSYLSNFK